MMPRDPRAYLQRAEEHRRHGRLKEAIALSIEALGKHPGLDAVRVTLGRAYLENAQPEEARTTLLDVFGRLPEHHLAGKLLVETQRLLGDLDGAAATCRTLLEHYPRDREIEPLLAEIVKAQSLPQAPDAAPPVPVRKAPPATLEPKPAPAAAEPRSAAPAPVAATPKPAAEEADPEPDYLPEDIGPMRAAPSVAPPAAVANPVEVEIPIPAPAAKPPAVPDRQAAAVSAAPVTAAPLESPAVPAFTAAPAPVPAVTTASAPAVATVAAPAPAPVASAVSPVTAPLPAAPPKRDALETNTLAELYVKQGLPDRAIEVYRSMLRVEPGNAAARRRLAEIEAAGAGLPAPAAKPATAAPVPRPVAPPAVPPVSSISMAEPARSPAIISASPAPVPVPAAPSERGAAAPAPAIRNAADQVAIERLERWLDGVKRGQKSLDDGAAA